MAASKGHLAIGAPLHKLGKLLETIWFPEVPVVPVVPVVPEVTVVTWNNFEKNAHNRLD